MNSGKVEEVGEPLSPSTPLRYLPLPLSSFPSLPLLFIPPLPLEVGP